MSVNISQRGKFATELLATMTGSNVVIGSLQFPPVAIFFDNLSTVPVTISVNGSNWKTFAGGSAIALDCRANHGIASNYSFDVGTTFVGNGASGDFSIAYVYAENI